MPVNEQSTSTSEVDRQTPFKVAGKVINSRHHLQILKMRTGGSRLRRASPFGLEKVSG